MDLGEVPLTGEEWPVPAFPEGTTPKDRAGIIKDRAKLNAPAYNELETTGIRSNEHAALRMKRLEQLNESGQLPEGVEKINLDSDGNLRIPGFSTPEAEEFVKILNQFSENAKNTYGSRVTNFDLQQYMRTFPNLWNTEEGRRRIIRQIQIVSEMNSLYDRSLSRCLQKVWGRWNRKNEQADQLAEEEVHPLVQRLHEEYLNNMPSSSGNGGSANESIDENSLEGIFG